MSKIKRLLDDVADDVSTAMEKNKVSFDIALHDVLMRHNIIRSSDEIDTISQWKQNIYPMIA